MYASLYSGRWQEDFHHTRAAKVMLGLLGHEFCSMFVVVRDKCPRTQQRPQLLKSTDRYRTQKLIGVCS
jgi:hypothetical protein